MNLSTSPTTVLVTPAVLVLALAARMEGFEAFPYAQDVAGPGSYIIVDVRDALGAYIGDVVDATSYVPMSVLLNA